MLEPAEAMSWLMYSCDSQKVKEEFRVSPHERFSQGSPEFDDIEVKVEVDIKEEIIERLTSETSSILEIKKEPRHETFFSDDVEVKIEVDIKEEIIEESAAETTASLEIENEPRYETFFLENILKSEQEQREPDYETHKHSNDILTWRPEGTNNHQTLRTDSTSTEVTPASSLDEKIQQDLTTEINSHQHVPVDQNSQPILNTSAIHGEQVEPLRNIYSHRHLYNVPRRGPEVTKDHQTLRTDSTSAEVTPASSLDEKIQQDGTADLNSHQSDPVVQNSQPILNTFAIHGEQVEPLRNFDSHRHLYNVPRRGPEETKDHRTLRTDSTSTEVTTASSLDEKIPQDGTTELNSHQNDPVVQNSQPILNTFAIHGEQVEPLRNFESHGHLYNVPRRGPDEAKDNRTLRTDSTSTKVTSVSSLEERIQQDGTADLNSYQCDPVVQNSQPLLNILAIHGGLVEPLRNFDSHRHLYNVPRRDPEETKDHQTLRTDSTSTEVTTASSLDEKMQHDGTADLNSHQSDPVVQNSQPILNTFTILGLFNAPSSQGNLSERPKPYKCQYCDRSFAYLSSLEFHSEIGHTGEKPFPCPFCVERFPTLEQLKDHEGSHVDNTPLQPLLCNTLQAKERTPQEEKQTPKPGRHVEGEKQNPERERPVREGHQIPEAGRQVHEEHVSERGRQAPQEQQIPEMDKQVHEKLQITEKKVQVIPKIKRTQCPICLKTFRTKLKLKRHKIVHIDEKPYQCRFCQKSFARKSYVSTHEMTHSVEKKFKCHFCDAKFKTPSSLRQHRVNKHVGSMCDVCGKMFATVASLRKHKRNHVKKRPYQCQTCKRRFLSLNELEEHLRMHTGGKPYQCKLCKATFSSARYLDLHKRKHSDAKQCKVSTGSTVKRKKGNRVASKNETPIKETTAVMLNNVADRSQIVQRHHSSCSQSDKGVSKSSELKSHEITNIAKKPLTCQFCGKHFATRRMCNEHEKIHSGKDRFRCFFCEKEFSTLKRWQEHELTHDTEKPYQCQFCDAPFSRYSELASHKKTHTGDKPYECQICKGRLGSLRGLIVHRSRLHSKRTRRK